MTLKLLLVEDDAPTLSELSQVLAAERFEVFQASDGKAGLTAFEREHADVLITDLKMPAMGGLELMRRVKALRPDVPVILTTAYGETDTAIEALRLGALDYFKKPVELDELLLAVGRAREVALRNRQAVDYPTVLLAEDDELTRKNLAEVLAKEEWRVVTAQDGQDALDIFRRQKTDIVLVDIKMPRLDGIGALAAMRALRDDFEAIVLTGYGDEGTAIQALRNGAMSFIRKPVDLDELFVTLQKAREKLSLERALRYRTREVDLAQQIIAQISEHGEIVVRVTESTLDRAKAQVAQALNHLSDGVAVLDESMRVVFVNQRLVQLLEALPTEFDEGVWQKLAAASQGELTAQEVADRVTRVLHGPIGGLETAPSANGFGLLCTKARARSCERVLDCVVLLASGLGG